LHPGLARIRGQQKETVCDHAALVDAEDEPFYSGFSDALMRYLYSVVCANAAHQWREESA
jgi:hypothetical protein